MSRGRRMKLGLVVAMALALTACCMFGGELQSTGIDLGVSMTWAGGLPPAGTTATVDFYLMVEGTGNWALVEADVPFPGFEGTLVDTFWYEYEVPTNGDHITYRYEVDMDVAGEVYHFACEGNEWWWYAAGAIHCGERER